jgi:hypothetical protein
MYFLLIGTGKSYGYWGGGKTRLEALANFKKVGGKLHNYRMQIFKEKGKVYGLPEAICPYVDNGGGICWSNDWIRIYEE